MGKTAFLFSGQGSQYEGMGKNLVKYEKGRETFQEAGNILDIDITHLCCNGSGNQLADTKITQPAVLTCSIAAYRILSEEIDCPVCSLIPSATAGLSVGEYSALIASGVLDFKEALEIVKERGRLMAKAASEKAGFMVAILGIKDNSIIESICKKAEKFGIVGPANYNCPGQVVISGDQVGIQKAVDLAREAGARRCQPLSVHGAFHSPLMHSAEIGLRKVLNKACFARPEIPFVANVTGDYIDDPDKIREILALQMSSPIQWETSISRMIDEGIESFMEFGPGKVLSGLIHRIDKNVQTYNSDSLLDNTNPLSVL
ncbi:ACP S-malonyltransferase [Candidatus Poribacteria bacterium]|nr:ACP S-malonyltransferase [Candidatus Poribacteria bacterium]